MDDHGTRVVGIGASAGGVEALSAVLAGLTRDFTATVLVVLHQADTAPGRLADLLDRRCALPVVPARDGEPVESGRVHVAVPGHHLLVEKGVQRVSRGPRENGHRPAIDPLFRSLALYERSAAVGVVLSGMLDDGSAGLLDLVRHGGTAVVQDPDDAIYPGMPEAALRQVPGALVRPGADLGPLLAALATRPALATRRRGGERLGFEVDVARGERLAESEPPGPAAGLSCPDCDGPLYDVGDPHVLRYRCRIGHAWSQDSLRAGQDTRAERALDTALRALEEKAALHHRIARHADGRGSSRTAERARQTARDALAAAAVVRDLIPSPQGGEPP
ncbi:chemotaxis protein CheB [Actinomycetospora termitidis]|uniref:protein-glutamate methylesterase n=1 Tax=Actinomycetospora termitidis TaxID=3053470 RepID=A0ABT7MKH0_9PSEU|nr:chemotaxis protein CheB [Actinomycetospora sp. Odt1-22]MDL5159853.1 chemotaxis protein CheB [Actinomycetospora sp. Odt1-22]